MEENTMVDPNENKETYNDNLNMSENLDNEISDLDLAPEQVAEIIEKKKNRIFGRKEDKCKMQIETLEVEKQELNDKFLRLYSEFENYKKRTSKERLDLLNTAAERVIVSLLPIIDDFERAIKANETVTDMQVMKEGFDLIYNKFLQLLKKFDVEEIPAIGELFNTDFHEAITHFPAQNEEDKGKVIDVVEKGYKIKNKVTRFAKVVVAN